MRSQRHSMLIGAFFLIALLSICKNSPHAFAATTGLETQHTAYQSSLRHDVPMQDYNQGHINGYNDCGNGLPHASTWFQSPDYQQGYNNGYQDCEDLRQAGAKQGNHDGFDAGNAACQQEYTSSQSPSSQENRSFAAPQDQTYPQAYDLAWKQGYNQCRQDHGDKPVY